MERAAGATDHRTVLLEEYKMAVQLYIHEDENRLNRVSAFLLAQVVPLTLFGVFRDTLAVVMALGVFGLCVSIVMAVVIERQTAYTRFRAGQLRYLESLLDGPSTFRHEFTAFGSSQAPEGMSEERSGSTHRLLRPVRAAYQAMRQVRFAALCRVMGQPSAAIFTFPLTGDQLRLTDLARFSANEAEHKLPWLTSAIWVGVFVWAVVQAV